MAITSYGYGGTVEESAWARLAPRLGVPYWVKDSGSLVASIDTAKDRAIVLAPGEFGGTGIFDVSNAVESVQFDPISSGTRFDMVVARRDWQGVSGKTTFSVIKGGKMMVLPTYNRNPGVIDDHPLYLVELRAGQSRPAAIYDLRGFGANGKVIVNNKLAMDYYNEYPGLELQVGREIYTVRGGRTWMRTGLEPHTTYGRDEYYVRFNTGLVTFPDGGGKGRKPVTKGWAANAGDNAMGVSLKAGGKFRITKSGIYSINLNVYDYAYNKPTNFMGRVSVGLNTPDLPRVATHRHDRSSHFETFIGTTQLLKEGFEVVPEMVQYRYTGGGNGSTKYRVELALHMIG